MQLLNIDEVSGSGFTIITVESDPLNRKITQESLNELTDKLEALLIEYGFEISLACENEDAARVQAKVMIDRYWKKLDNIYKNDEQND